MKECEYFEQCSIFSNADTDGLISFAIKGFVMMYCKGRKQPQCIRRRIMQQLGNPTIVPKNMMPSGRPFQNTDTAKWRPEVEKLADQLRFG